MNRNKIVEEYFYSPFDVLLSLKDPREYESEDLCTRDDYLEMTGFTDEHVPHLLKIMELWLDDDLRLSDDLSLALAPIHAWRILGQLQSEDAIEPLLAMLDPMDKSGDDWYLEEYPNVFRDIGPKAIPMLKSYLQEAEKHELYAAVCVSTCIRYIGNSIPEMRDEAVSILTGKLEEYNQNDTELNAFLVDNLIELEAVEAAELIERAFADHAVDFFVNGDWGEVKRRLEVEGMGLAPERDIRNHNPMSIFMNTSTSSNNNAAKNKSKSKRKKAKKSRKKNRKKKK